MGYSLLLASIRTECFPGCPLSLADFSLLDDPIISTAALEAGAVA
jgi:hypothetical protein